MEGIQAHGEGGDAENVIPLGTERRLTLLHGIVPPVLGIFSGLIAHQDRFADRFDLGLGDFDGLVIGCLLVIGLLSLLGLLIHPMSRVIDHAIGVSLVVSVVLAMILLGRICGVSVALTMWSVISISWSNRPLPPFRIGLWHGLGGCTGVIVGSIFASI